MTELTNRHIPGITWKQIVGFAIAIALGVGFYINLKNAANDAKKQSADNYELLKEYMEEAKRDRRLDDAKMLSIELQMRECKIRLDIMEANANYLK